MKSTSSDLCRESGKREDLVEQDPTADAPSDGDLAFIVRVVPPTLSLTFFTLLSFPTPSVNPPKCPKLLVLFQLAGARTPSLDLLESAPLCLCSLLPRKEPLLEASSDSPNPPSSSFIIFWTDSQLARSVDEALELYRIKLTYFFHEIEQLFSLLDTLLTVSEGGVDDKDETSTLSEVGFESFRGRRDVLLLFFLTALFASLNPNPSIKIQRAEAEIKFCSYLPETCS